MAMQYHRGASLLTLGALIACSHYSEPGADLVVTVTTSAPAIAPGDTLQIRLEVRNTGERTDSIAVPGPDCPLLWRIDGPGGVYGGPNGVLAADGNHCTPRSGTLRLQPGEAVAVTYGWTGQRGTLKVRHELPPGRYAIRAATQPAANIDRMVQSRPVEVQLVARR